MKIDVFSYANNTWSLFVQALLGQTDKDGKSHSKIAVALIERDKNHNRIRGFDYFFDIDIAEVIFTDLARQNVVEKYERYKKTDWGIRAIRVYPDPGSKSYVFSLMNEKKGEPQEHGYMKIPDIERRAMAISVLRTLRQHHFLQMLAAWKA